MRVLITGGAGFIGSHIIKEMLRQKIDIVSYDISPLNNASSEVLTNDELNQVISVSGDICDFPALCRTIREYGITHVIHMASMLIDAASSNPFKACEIMNGGMIHVLEAARLFQLKKVVWASSMSVFSTKLEHEPVLNDAPHSPETVYGACKSWGEQMARHYFNEWGVDSVGLRYGVVYGFGRLRGPSRFATELIRLPAVQQPFEFQYGNSVVDWQYVGDAAKVTVKALLSDTLPRRCYNIRGEERRVADAADLVRKFIPDARIHLGNEQIRIVPTGSDDALFADLGYRCETSLEQGIYLTINDYRQSTHL